eukprot:584373-Alexandrium_andersonii.AAC.1
MSASLVGSEMCIRDRIKAGAQGRPPHCVSDAIPLGRSDWRPLERASGHSLCSMSGPDYQCNTGLIQMFPGPRIIHNPSIRRQS